MVNKYLFLFNIGMQGIDDMLSELERKLEAERLEFERKRADDRKETQRKIDEERQESKRKRLDDLEELKRKLDEMRNETDRKINSLREEFEKKIKEQDEEIKKLKAMNSVSNDPLKAEKNNGGLP